MDKPAKTVRLPVSMFLAPRDVERVRGYIKRNALKAGPWIGKLVLREIDQAERIAAGRTQVDMDEIEARR